MRNLILIIAETLICYLSIILLYKKYKTDGLYVYGIIATITSCIMILKQIDLMSVTIPLGLCVTTSLIITGNIITQKRGPDELKTYIILVLITALLSCGIFSLSGLMESSQYNEYANKAYDSIFKFNLRIYLALIISITTSIFLSSKLYYLLKRLQNKIIISNIFSIIIIELLENTIFTLLAYLFIQDAINVILILVFRYILKTIIGLLGTIPIYICNKTN